MDDRPPPPPTTLFDVIDRLEAANKPASRNDQIYARFEIFHLHNPIVWQLFQRFAFEIIGAGRKHYSSAAIFERIRWHMWIETTGDDVKVNNDFRPLYARMFLRAFPQHGEFFSLRKLTSAERPAYATDLAVFHTGAPDDETELDTKLDALLARTPTNGNGHH